jgi:hypothetical protein
MAESTRAESPLVRMHWDSVLSDAEFKAGDTWRQVYLAYLMSIGAPAPFGGSPDNFSDEDAKDIARKYKRGLHILMSRGKRVYHAVNAITVYGEPDGLGDPTYTAKAAKVGLAALAMEF